MLGNTLWIYRTRSRTRVSLGRSPCSGRRHFRGYWERRELRTSCPHHRWTRLPVPSKSRATCPFGWNTWLMRLDGSCSILGAWGRHYLFVKGVVMSCPLKDGNYEQEGFCLCWGLKNGCLGTVWIDPYRRQRSPSDAELCAVKFLLWISK